MATRIKRINKSPEIVSQGKRILRGFCGSGFHAGMSWKKQGVTAEELFVCEILVPERGRMSRLKA